MDAVFADRAYQLTRYQINDPLMMENSDQLSAVYSNGLEEVNYLGDMGQLLRVLSDELNKYSCTMMMNELPLGSLRIKYQLPGSPEEMYYSWSYPIYREFDDMLALLKEQGAYVEVDVYKRQGWRQSEYLPPLAYIPWLRDAVSWTRRI